MLPLSHLSKVLLCLFVTVVPTTGCNTKSQEPPAVNHPAETDSPSPPEAIRTESNSPEVPRAEFSGTHDLNGSDNCANNLLGASVLSAGMTGHFTDSISDLTPYLAFSDCVGYGTLVRTDLPDGRWLIALELPVGETSLARFEGQSHGPKPDWLADFAGTLGIHNDVVRTRLVDTDYNRVVAGDPLDEVLYSQYLARFDTNLWPHAELIPGSYVPAARTKENAKYGFLIEQVRDALRNYPLRLHSSKQVQTPEGMRWATSLAEAGDMYGGLNAAAWINPYTGQPIVHVPFDSRCAGNYTELQDPLGVLVFFHYRNEQGGISTTIAGDRGVYELYTGPAMGATAQ